MGTGQREPTPIIHSSPLPSRESCTAASASLSARSAASSSSLVASSASSRSRSAAWRSARARSDRDWESDWESDWEPGACRSSLRSAAKRERSSLVRRYASRTRSMSSDCLPDSSALAFTAQSLELPRRLDDLTPRRTEARVRCVRCVRCVRRVRRPAGSRGPAPGKSACQRPNRQSR
ncbi:hypothetical protein ACFPRL_10315 [Pseudoclavibacter helvolus]